MQTVSFQHLRQHLEVIRQTNLSALSEQSPLAPQPHHIKLPLQLHQLAALHAMKEKETSLRHSGLQIGEEHLYSDYAVLGDRVGVGKTFITLGHISQMVAEGLEATKPNVLLHKASTSHCFSLSKTQPPEHLFSSLIVVPHTIYRQWQDAIQTHTTLVPLLLKTQRDLDKDNLVQRLGQSDCVLIANTLFPYLLNSLAAREIQPTWRRIFYDEADTIKLKSTCPQPKAWMTWYITGTYSSLLFANLYYHSHLALLMPEEYIQSLDEETEQYLRNFRSLHPTVSFFRTESYPFFSRRLESRHPLRGHLVVRSSPSFLATSVQLPPLLRSTVWCEALLSHRLLQNTLPSEAEQALHAGDIQGALQILGCNSHTPLTLVEAATAYRKKELDRLQRLLEFKQQEEYATPQAKEQAIAHTQEKINRLQEQVQAITTRLQEVSKEGCSICFDTAENPCVTPCCNRTFCGGCILEWMLRSVACPLCRASIHPNQLLQLQTSSASAHPHVERKPKKMEALLQVLEANPEGRFLIFSRYETTFSTIQEHLGQNTRVAVLQGNKDVVAHTIANFTQGNIRALLMCSKSAAAGMNLQSATHIILLHRMHPEEEKQILGRAYRIGRETPLHCISLLHEKE